MTIATIVKYLVGSRRAILDIAASPQSTWLGLLFVLSAGFAREYDGADLLHESWHLVIPLGTSLVSSFLLFCVVFGMARRRGCKEGTFRDLYVTFLRLYWMTAPLAWLYAIPVEQDKVGATHDPDCVQRKSASSAMIEVIGGETEETARPGQKGTGKASVKAGGE